MSQRPDLIVFSQNLLGGGASFHRNMLANFPRDFFEIKCIYLNPTHWHGTKALEVELNPNDAIFSYGEEPARIVGKKLSKLIPATEGVIVANLETELISLDLYRKPQKTVFFICHDDGFIPLAVKYQSIIDVYITHNIAIYHELRRLIGKRQSDIHFIQHGVQIPDYNKVINTDKTLKIVFLARHHAFKGIYDLPVINQILVDRGVSVDWMILGDGPERNDLIKKVEGLPNFQFYVPKTSAEVVEILKEQDVFILPSRSDGLPVALLESMSVGCVPVIANFSDGIKKVVTDQIGFVVPVGDNYAFADKIMDLSGNRSLLKTLSVNCAEKVKDEFDIKKQAMEYYNLYKNYKTLKRKQILGLKDLHRLAGYNRYYNRAIHMLKRVKTKLVSTKDPG
jgi:glycosyltransferase involved in cell wall biosynthesis